MLKSRNLVWGCFNDNIIYCALDMSLLEKSGIHLNFEDHCLWHFAIFCWCEWSFLNVLFHYRPHTTVKESKKKKSFHRQNYLFQRDLQTLDARAARAALSSNVHHFCIPKSSCLMRETDFVFPGNFDVVCGLYYFVYFKKMPITTKTFYSEFALMNCYRNCWPELKSLKNCPFWTYPEEMS